MIRLRRCLLVTVACAGLAACVSDAADEASPGVPGEGDTATAGDPAGAGTGTVRGVVRDAATDRPIDGALVTAGSVATTTDADGRYVLAPLVAGDWSVRAYERGFTGDSARIEAAPGRVASIDFALPPAAPPCCDLAGRWSGRFTLDSAGIAARPARRELRGALLLDPDSLGARQGVAASRGASELDFGPLLGSGVTARVGELEGVVFAGDSVAITLLPRFGDWAIELRGRHAGDTIRGDWFQRASCCGAYGGFELVRDGS